MTTVSKEYLSGAASSYGLPIAVAATSSPGTTIHQAVASITSMDEIYLYATNLDTVVQTLILQWGDNARLRKFDLLPNVETKVADGFLLANSLYVKAYCGTANKIEIVGYVHRIVP